VHRTQVEKLAKHLARRYGAAGLDQPPLSPEFITAELLFVFGLGRASAERGLTVREGEWLLEAAIRERMVMTEELGTLGGEG